MSDRRRIRTTTTITSTTLLGGDDDPNCFSLLCKDSPFTREAVIGGQMRDVRIVNMKAGPFRRAVKSIRPACHDVEVELLADGVGIIADPRFSPKEMHNDRWCGVCCRFRLLPEEQQRARLAYETPDIRDGELISWSAHLGPDRKRNTPEQVEEFLAQLRAIGAA